MYDESVSSVERERSGVFGVIRKSIFDHIHIHMTPQLFLIELALAQDQVKMSKCSSYTYSSFTIPLWVVTSLSHARDI